MQILLGSAEARQDQAQRVAALVVARHRVRLQLGFDLPDQAHSASPDSPTEHVPVQMEDRLSSTRADVEQYPIVIEPRLAGRVGDELEHALRLVRRELADLAERVDVALRQDEQVRLRLRGDVADGDEAVGRVDVIALADERQKRQSGAAARRESPPP